jgi:hypothetical protein
VPPCAVAEPELPGDKSVRVDSVRDDVDRELRVSASSAHRAEAEPIAIDVVPDVEVLAIRVPGSPDEVVSLGATGA